MKNKKEKCLMCGKDSESAICEACKDKVHAEATHKKRKIEGDKKE
jgi:hypothetical protein